MYHYNLGMYFEGLATANPDNCALRYSNREYTYNETLLLAQRLSKLLKAIGCTKGGAIAIGNNKNALAYALMLAGLRLGIPYVNIDTLSPVKRNASILSTCGATHLFYDSADDKPSMTELAGLCGCETTYLDESDLPQIISGDVEEQKKLVCDVDGSCIAYVMFTSGSTGIAKGVAVTHQNLVHLIHWGRSEFKICDADNFANLSPMYFDNSVFDFYVALFSGASLTPVNRALLTSPYELTEYINRQNCTIWFSVPSLLIYLVTMRAVTEKAFPAMRNLIFGGEGYPKTELKKLYSLFGGRSPLFNVYGPTECTCICSAHKITDKDFEDMHGLPTLGKT